MWAFFNKQAKIRKKAKQAIGFAHKVLAYRKDLLSDLTIELIEQKAEDIEKAYKENWPKDKFEPLIDEMEKLLKKHGGKIFKDRAIAENVEMVIVAAILAIGVRTYFIQPFKIPTNSMWPTYAGLNATVYPPQDPRPSGATRAFLGLTQGLPQSVFGGFNYYITTPVAGELVIPVQSYQGGEVVKPYVKGREETGIELPGGIRVLNNYRKILRDYTILVGGQPINVETPGDFELDDVIVQSWFPDYDKPGKGLSAVYRDMAAEGKVKPWANDPNVKLIFTGIQLDAEGTVLDFNINSGDMLFVDRFSYNFVRPKIGAPFVFRTNEIPGLRTQNNIGQWVPDERYYIKRLVGMGGDTLEVKGATLYRNGEPITGADAFDKNAQQTDGYPGYEAKRHLAPSLVENIPDGYYYAMGDNSPHSSDSRYWGMDSWGNDGGSVMRTPKEIEDGVPVNMVPDTEVVGSALFIFYPFSHRWGLAE